MSLNQEEYNSSVEENKPVETETSPFQKLMYELRDEGVRVSTSEWLDLQRLMDAGEVHNVDELYVIARMVLVKDATDYPVYDRVFGKLFFGLEVMKETEEQIEEEVEDEESVEETTEDDDEPSDVKESEQKDKENIEDVVEAGSETSEAVHGGNEATKDIEFSKNAADEGEKGKNSEGEIKGMDVHSAREKIKQHSFENLRDDKTLGYEQFGRALSRLVTLISEATENKTRKIDAKATARNIARHAGSPEFVWTDELENKPNVVILFDVGGSTDRFRQIIENLFSAAKDYLEGMEIYYFHNAIYGEVWPQSDGNYGKRFIPLSELLRKDSDTKFIIVGDAEMGWNDWQNGGLEDSYNDLNPDDAKSYPHFRNTGLDNFAEIVEAFPATVWLNPILEKDSREGTIAEVAEVVPMYDLSLVGIEAAVKKLMEDN